MKNTKTVQVWCAVLLIASMSAALPVQTIYAAENNTTQSQNQSSTLKYGKVTAISSDKVKVTLGTISDDMGGFNTSDQNGMVGNTPPDMPGGQGFGGNGMGTPPDMPGSQGFGGNMGTPPEMPSSGFGGNMSTPPDMPDGNNTQSGQFGQMPDDSKFFIEGSESVVLDLTGVSITRMGQTASISDISEGTILTLVYEGSTLTEVKIGIDRFGGMGKPDGQGGMGQSKNVELKGRYTADNTTKSAKSKKYTSTAADTSVILTENGGKYSVTSSKLYKKGDSSNVDSSNFYGLNSIAVAQADSEIRIKNSYLYSDAEGANAVFATGENAKVTVSGTTIITKGNSSRGLDVTLGGTITADDMKIKTTGAHCAPVATDRGGGTINVSNSTLQASGDGSPCIYSTGDITAVKCKGKATGSQIAVVEGKNSITLKNCSLTGAGKNGIMLYQSTSGDAEVGTAVLTSTSSTLKTTSDGPMFYVTNTDAVINLKNTKLKFSSGVLLDCAGNNTNNWGKPGYNGGDVVLNATKQSLSGDITCDDISTVRINLTSSSTLKGAVDTSNTGDVGITLDSTSVWNVTADSYGNLEKQNEF